MGQKQNMLFPAETYKKKRQRKKRWQKFARFCAAVTVFCTVYSLILPAITMAETIYCGQTEHRHSESCYESRLICGYTETEPAETLSATTVAEEMQPETTKTEDATTPVQEHVHTDTCYEQVLICEEQEHTHTLSCFADPDADVESADVWARSVSGVTLSGKWNEDLAAIAESQLGYHESEKNYQVAWDGITKNGYTRYGAWYGESYANDWSALFAAFCLHYAGVSKEAVPHAATCAEWASMLKSGSYDLYISAGDGAPVRGDLLFLDLDADETADHAGVVTACGDGKLKAVVGDLEGKVQLVTYPADDARILGFAKLPENPDADSMEATEPDVNAPEATAPEANIPEATVPEATMPEEVLSADEIVLADDSMYNKAALLALAAKAAPGTLQNEINQIAALANPVGTVTLNRDYTENLTIPDNTEVTLDLNGHTLAPIQQANSSARNHITVYGTLTITDSGANGKLANSAGYSNIRAITVASGARLTMLGGTISGYNVSGSGAGVRVETNGQFSMQGGTITGNTANYYGGGIYTYDISSLSLTGGTLSGNYANYGGGIASYHSTTTADTPFYMANVVLADNSASYYGGGFYAREDIHIELESVTITGNSAEESGGGLYFESYASLSMGAGSAISNNDAVKNGGGVYFTSSTTRAASDFTMTGGEIRGNSAGYLGGGVGYAESPAPKTGGVVRISGGVIADNVSNDRGGGLYLPEKTEFVLSGGEIAGNHAASYGGGFFVCKTSSFTMTGGEIRGNVLDNRSAVTYGAGGLLNGHNTVTLSGGSIVENTGAVYGGGLNMQEDCTLTIEGDIEIARNTVDSATATCRGAGLYADIRCHLTMTGGIITENHSSSSVEGVGLYLVRDGSYSITGGKITNNTASGGNTANGGGIYLFDHLKKSTLTVGGTAEISGNSLSTKSNSYGGGIGTGAAVILCGNAVVRNNSSAIGGGVSADALTLSDNAVITQNTGRGQGGGASIKNLHMSGGSITDNHTGGNGGGVYLERYVAQGSVNEITGGEISGNTANAAGGGIYLYGHYTTPETGIALHITGGSIADNDCVTWGGGVYVTNGARLLLAGGSIVGNHAEAKGGGICLERLGQRIFADAPEDKAAYTLEVKAGSTLSGNTAGTQGHDLYVDAYHFGGVWKQPYFHVDAAEALGGDGSAWHDEVAHAVCDGEMDNRAEIQQMEQSGKYEHRSYAYTFVKRTAGAAQVESTVYPSVQSAVDAIAAGTHTDTTVIMLADSREEVTIPENLTVTLDLAGYTLSGITGSVLTVRTGADLTVRDTSAAQTGTVTRGRGTRIGTGTNTAGGGVYVLGGHLTVEGGTFRENDATFGSAIFLASDAEVTMTGGSITGNTARTGKTTGSAAVTLGEGNQAAGKDRRFTMRGGSITDNLVCGIAVFQKTSVLTIAGTAEAPVAICGNQGIGIYGNSESHINVTYANISDNNGNGLFLNAHAELSHCTISGNRSDNGGGINVFAAETRISDTVITNNVATKDGGGIYVVSSLASFLGILDGVQVYGNTAANFSNDLFFGRQSYVYGAQGTAGTPQDTRAAKNMNLPDGLAYWYDNTQNVYYVENGNTESQSWGVPVKTVGFNGDNATSMVDGKNNQVLMDTSLTAVRTPDVDPVAKIGERTFPTLAAALGAAAVSTDPAVTVELLRDVTESASIHGGADAPAITLDLAGHTVSAPIIGSNIFKLYSGSNLTIMDSSEEQTGALLPGANENTRAVYVNGSSFTLQSGTIRGFTLNSNGGAIYAEAGKESTGVHVTIAGGVIEDCTANAGGAVYLDGGRVSSFTMTGGIIRNCTAKNGDGGGINIECYYADGGAVRISGGTISGCKTSKGGGAIRYSGPYRGNIVIDEAIYGVTIENCVSQGAGGGLYIQRAGMGGSPLYFGTADTPTLIRNNRAEGEAGGVYLNDIYNGLADLLVLTNVTIEGNTSKKGIGGFRVYGAEIRLNDLSITGNRSSGANSSGIGVAGGWIQAVQLDMKGGIVANNSGGDVGGIIIQNLNGALPEGATPAEAPFSLRDVTFSGNYGSIGGGLGIRTQKDTLLERVTVTDNTAGDCGGICMRRPTSTAEPIYTLRHCTVTGNTVTRDGGGIGTNSSASVRLVLEDTEVSGNRAGGKGGGIYLNAGVSSLTLRSGTSVCENTATSGGGIYVENANVSISEGVEISRNAAASSGEGYGGGIRMRTSADAADTIALTMTGGVIADNTAKTGGGIYIRSETKNRTFAVNITGGELRGNRSTENGGAIFAGSNGSTQYRRVTVTIGGDAVVSENNAGSCGGGIYVNYRVDLILEDNARITGNHAELWGGGVYQAYFSNRVFHMGGLIYNNSAASGQDVHVVYDSRYRSSRIKLLDAEEMSKNGLIVSGWLDEGTNRVYSKDVRFDPATKSYPLTLLYTTETVSAIVEKTDGSYVAYDLIQDAVNAAGGDGMTGNVILVNDSVETVTIPASAEITLNLNGYTLKGSGNSAIICRGTLTVEDKMDKESYPAVHARTGEEATYAPKTGATGTITGHAYQAGGGVYVDGGAVTMTGGRIAGCVAGRNTANASYGGGAVCVYAGSFTLAGGELTENTARYGAAVLVSTASAKFNMTGGAITNNTASDPGADTPNGYGAIFNRGGSVGIYGGTISGNTAGYGGALYNQTGTANISGSSTVIRGNTGVHRGGAICMENGTVNITGGSILENRTTVVMSGTVNTWDGYAQSAGGAIYVGNGRLNVSGDARIAGNRAVRGGAIAQYNGTVNILGGTVTGNTATFGGGIAQNPLPGNNSTWMHIMGGKIYGNTATREIGNDLYSAYEGTEDYQVKFVNKSLVPHMSILAASGMLLDSYNVWKDDTYEGGNRTGMFIGEGQFITSSISASNNLALTADSFDTEIKTVLDTNFKVISMSVGSMTDGTASFDNGGTYQSVKYDNAAERERFAKDLLDAREATESTETYVYNGDTYPYISYNGKLYEQNQAVTWWHGNDANAKNAIVRTFDSVAYILDMTVEYDETQQFDRETEHTYQIWLRAVLPCTPDEATFTNIASIGLSGYALTSGLDDAGNEYQMLEGYWEIKTHESAEQIAKPLTIAFYGMANGDTVKPTFETYVVGNTQNQSALASCASETLTVSAAPSYNVTVDYNSTLAYTGYFDTVSGVEVPETVYKASKAEGYTGNPIVYGMIQGYGVTLELYNDPSGKGMKGIELPKGAIDFDLHFRGQVYMNGKLLEGGFSAPYVWAYKSNDSNTYGTALGTNIRDRNMDWNDVDDLSKTTYYAYNAAPYNAGGGISACYNGGMWSMSGSQPDETSKETLLHATVSGYSFDTSGGPANNSNGVRDDVLASSAVKAFSAGYVQVLFPVDKEQITESAGGETGYVEVAMKAAASNLSITSLSGQTPIREGASDLNAEAMEKQLDSMNGYFERENAGALEEEKTAVHETRYADNYATCSAGLYIFNGGGSGDSIWKESHFDSSNGGTRLTNDAGTGETPIGSTAYVEGYLSFSSGTIDASNAAKNDPLYNVEFWTNAEHNYMTAANILQKFDASVYTPVGTEPIVNKAYKLTGNSNNIGGGAFLISTSETSTNWSWNANATQSYTLTILYAAKPDGTNWTYRTRENGTDDGGVADMDAHREENLLYFTTLRELRAYFEAQGKVGKCVAILYQFRNCCIRTGRTLTAKAKLQVTEDLEKTGDTYCTTNDVRTWTTYRPYYKLYSALEGTSKSGGGTYRLQDITYQFNWVDVPYDGNAYGAVLPTGNVYMAGAGNTVVSDDIGTLYNDNRDGNVRSRPGSYQDGYIKTEYSGGNKVGGTHTGALSGNTLLLYTLDTSINIGINTRAAGSNAAKTEYTITRGEREVEYRVTPGIHISSGSKNVELVTNGTQRTAITVTLTLPNGLTYRDGSMTFDYTVCDYNAGDLQWNVTSDPNDPHKIILTTSVSDIDRGLPAFNFTCNIGDALDADKDIKNGTSLTVTASIEAKYEEHSLVAAQTHTDSATIMVLLDTNNGVYKGVGAQLLEVGEDIVYMLTYSDNTETSQTNLAFADVLPYNGDSRKTTFTGGYYVKDIAIHFSGTNGQANYQTFVDSGYLAYQVGCRYAGSTAAEKTLLEVLESSGNKLTAVPNAETRTVTFRLPTGGSALVQKAETGSGIALYGSLPNLLSDSRFAVTVTLSPRDPSDSEALLLDSSGKTQSGGQTYGNDFFYATSESSAPARSNAVHVSTVNRRITGVVWMDNDRDGMYETRESLLQNIDVYLYTASGERAKDMLGKEIPKYVTGKNGAYCFENLPEGEYMVVFLDDDNDYLTAAGTHPLDFNRLTVSHSGNKQAARGNKAVPVPDADVPYMITEAKLYTTVGMPAKEQIPSNPYTSPNWNLGLYSAYGYELPMTGGSGTTLYTAGGALLMACAGILLLYSKKKRRKEEIASS